MNILGISCHYHDSAACLVKDGKVVVAVQEERFNRLKNSPDFPINAINYCIQEGGITFDDLDYVGFYEKPYLKFSRMVIGHLRSWPFSLNNFLNTMPNWLQDRLVIPITIEKEVGFKGKVIFIKHHLSHAASSFLVSPFEEAAILTADAVGEWATMTYGVGRGNKIDIQKEIRYPNSLGLLYTAITTYLGFTAHEGEGTVMALASCGEPRYVDKLKGIVMVKPDGSHMVDERFFGFNKGSRMYTNRFLKSFGPERKPGGRLEDRHKDIAASLQKFTEETLIAVARHVQDKTRLNKLCLAGGLFLNCVANSKILEQSGFKELFIQPAAGDSGGSLGAATYIYHCVLNKPRDFIMQHAYLGTGYPSNYIKRVILNRGVSFRELEDGELSRFIAREISCGRVVGWFQGKMEFGPRALGNRSILADPRNPDIKEILNEKVKHREGFRPYAPVILEERAGEFFNLECKSPFMLLAPMVKEEKKALIPGVVHVDGTARVQTVSKAINPRLWHLIKDFENITGIPVIINTSFNLRGEPIVCAPEDAISCFQRSQMDYLVLENFVIDRMKNNK
ncbi:MAG: carbamoyltransferase [Candidatus Omnitrophica bacterium]|nr:carbamoyltransferase [Candidatus Omnitrophota bacterium]MDD5770892.1 carbamoyltransferase [Candidatus Omnitrophota bacterium]